MIALFFLIIFGTMGVSYFKGDYYHCHLEHLEETEYGVGDLEYVVEGKWDCLCLGGEWVRYNRNFDDVLNSMSAAFVVSQTFDWSVVMYRAMAFRGQNLQPYKFSNPYNSIYFVVFIVFTNFLITNLFVGVVVSTYNNEKDFISNGSQLVMSQEQKQWLETKLLIMEAKPKFYLKTPKNKFRKFMYKIARHVVFDRFIIAMIVINTVLLCIKWFQEPELVDQVIDTLMTAISVIFFLEFLIKFIAFGLRYFIDPWNIFDFFLVFGTIIGQLLEVFLDIQSITTPSTILRTFRISRLIKLMRSMNSLYVIFETFIMVLPSLLNVGGLLMLLVFIYGVMGINLFATVKLNGSLFENMNFQSIWTASLTLLIMATGDYFNDIM
mmetsp:Transcript_29253/g.28351  ORF Transcript_29253/g.28351 Transcript_29253/m.28351 type:complete len:380 (-) Transcript_29253:1114-2253(-)